MSFGFCINEAWGNHETIKLSSKLNISPKKCNHAYLFAIIYCNCSTKYTHCAAPTQSIKNELIKITVNLNPPWTKIALFAPLKNLGLMTTYDRKENKKSNRWQNMITWQNSVQFLDIKRTISLFGLISLFYFIWESIVNRYDICIINYYDYDNDSNIRSR